LGLQGKKKHIYAKDVERELGKDQANKNPPPTEVATHYPKDCSLHHPARKGAKKKKSVTKK